MKPLRLAIKNLRSYRQGCEIDFKKGGLIAIVGDTGAGKSSILEAIVYALYNATTWDARGVKQLISTGEQTVSVELEFEAGGQRYRVHRATSQGAHPPSVHKLECMSDPKAPFQDGEEAVNREIEKLLGMNLTAFLAAVILPQGDFERLLQSRPGDRTKILKGIFRLDAVEEVRSRAHGILARVEPALNEIRNERARIPKDPEAMAREAREKLEKSREKRKALGLIQRRIREQRKATDAAEKLLGSLEGPFQRLDQIRAEVAAALEKLIPIEREILEARKKLEDELSRHRSGGAKLVERIEKIAVAGETLPALAAAREILARAEADLKDLEMQRERLNRENHELAAEEAELKKREQSIEKLATEATTAESAERELGKELEIAQKRVAEGAELIRGARAAQDELDSARKDAADIEEALRVREDKAGAAAATLENAEAAFTKTMSALEELQRRHAAAHLAGGLGEGDPCPVCRRGLPRGFRAATVPELGSAERAHTKAEANRKAALDAFAAAKAEISGGKNDLKKARSRLRTREAAASESLAALHEKLPGASLDQTSEAILASWTGAATNLLGKLDASRKAAQQARESVAAARAELASRKEAHAKNAKRHASESESRKAKEAALQASLEQLPKFLRPAKQLRISSVAPLCAELEARYDAHAKVERQYDEHRNASAQLTAELRELDSKYEREVGRPREGASGELASLRERVDDCRELLNQGPVEPLRGGASLETQYQWAKSLENLRGAALRALAGKLAEARDSIARAEAAMVSALREGGFESEEALGETIERISVEILKHEEIQQNAESHIRQARLLDECLGEAEAFADSLHELERLLADGKFVGHVTQLRQKSLLAVASEILRSMTGDRYGFAEDFQVVDRLSNQPRSTKTLSGGEGFLASLALALSLVEIAGRAGGRLDALFLDEGFGSLDANSLDGALSALEERAKGGRLVAVVSHLRAVAERIEDVLAVARTPRGSVAKWAEGTEREDWIERELEAGLLS
jgi:exonuclease SbcC